MTERLEPKRLGPKKLLRRSFLQLVGAAGIAAGLTACGADPDRITPGLDPAATRTLEPIPTLFVEATPTVPQPIPSVEAPPPIVPPDFANPVQLLEAASEGRPYSYSFLSGLGGQEGDTYEGGLTFSDVQALKLNAENLVYWVRETAGRTVRPEDVRVFWNGRTGEEARNTVLAVDSGRREMFWLTDEANDTLSLDPYSRIFDYEVSQQDLAYVPIAIGQSIDPDTLSVRWVGQVPVVVSGESGGTTHVFSPYSREWINPELASADLFNAESWPEQYRNTWNNPREASIENHRSLHAFLTELTRTTLQREAEQNPELARTVIRRLVDPVQEGVTPIVTGISAAAVDSMTTEEMREFFGRLTRNQQRWALCERQIALPEPERQPINWSAIDKAEIISDRDALVMDYNLLGRDRTGWDQRYPWLFFDDEFYNYGRWGDEGSDREYIYNASVNRSFAVPLYGRQLSEYVDNGSVAVTWGTPSTLAYGDLWGSIIFPGNLTNLALRQIQTDGEQSLVLYWFSGEAQTLEHIPFFGGLIRRPSQYYEDSGIQIGGGSRFVAYDRSNKTKTDGLLTQDILLQNVGRRIRIRNGIATWYIGDQTFYLGGYWVEGSTHVNEVTFQ